MGGPVLYLPPPVLPPTHRQAANGNNAGGNAGDGDPSVGKIRVKTHWDSKKFSAAAGGRKDETRFYMRDVFGPEDRVSKKWRAGHLYLFFCSCCCRLVCCLVPFFFLSISNARHWSIYSPYPYG